MHAVLSILAALVRRSLGGTAQHLDVSAAEGVVSLMSLVLDQYLATGEVSGSRQVLLTGRYACYDVYPCQDGKWISVGAIEPHFYRNLCGFLGLERWSDHQMDDAVQDEIRKDFRESFQKRDRDEWVERLASRDTCVAPVNDLAEVAEDPHFRARGVFLEANHPEAGLFDQVGPVLAGGHRALGRVEVRSSEESDVDQVMEDAGFTEAEMAELRSSGAVE